MSYLERLFRATEDENRRVILSVMDPRPGASLLDLGCGDGAWTMEVARHVGAEKVLGVEFIEEFAAAAGSAGVDVVAGDLGDPLPLEDGSVDVVHSNQVIEHVPKTDAFMREIARVLKPGGYAVVSTNNLSSWHNIVSLSVGWQPTPCHVSDEVIVGNPGNFVEGMESYAPGQTHLRIFTGRALAGLAAHHGLRADLELGAGYYPLPPRAASRLARLDPVHAAFLVQRYERA
ncbi:MAG TPA: class I SAM-dependent methyltransferase [Thermoleophilaceae bacterium]|nr:class I SAM-dependent methyltransferase [Thermoleophilaceae bacterium]